MNRDLRALGRELRPANPSATQPILAALWWLARHIPEALSILSPAAAWHWTAEHIGSRWATILLVVLVALLLALPWTRRAVTALVLVRVTRHRLRTGLIELRLTAHSGKPPVKLFIRPTSVGERVWLWLRAGVSAEDLADASEHLRAACWARDIRVTRNQRWSHLVTVDVIRRDPLAAKRIVQHPLALRVIHGTETHAPIP